MAVEQPWRIPGTSDAGLGALEDDRITVLRSDERVTRVERAGLSGRDDAAAAERAERDYG